MIGPADIEAWREDVDEAAKAESSDDARVANRFVRPRRSLLALSVADGLDELAAWRRRLLGRRG